jgi:putative transcription factor
MTIKMFARTMQCELCGTKAKWPLKTVRIEGAELEVCGECAKFGTEVQQPRKSAVKAAPRRTGPSAPSGVPAKHKRDVFDFMVGEIVDDYGERIRKARNEKGWSQKDLAMEIKERELLIKKVEKGDLIPEDELRIKLERVLGIRLIDVSEEDEAKRSSDKLVPTLGDVISIKKGQR